MSTLVFALAAYLIGSIPFAVVVSRAFGLSDPRSYGSGNPGATNVLRSGNKAAALLTLLGDGAKGWFAVWLALRAGAQFGGGDLEVAVAAVAVFLGHVFPVTLGFKGGKGVATAAGVLLALDPWLGLAVAGVWLATALLFRYSSLAAIAAGLAAPFLMVGFGAAGSLAAGVAAMSAILIWRHADNIRRLLAGTESRIGAKKQS